MSENLRAPSFHENFSQFVLHLPLRTSDIAATGLTSDMFQQALAHPSYDAFWRSVSTREQLSKVKIPVFSVGGWYDNFAESDLAAFAELNKQSGMNHVIIGPWPHNMSVHFTGVDFGTESEVPTRELVIEWFDQWLMGKDTPAASSAPVQLFLMGANRWLDTRDWPPEGSQIGGSANTLNGDGDLRDSPPAPKHAGVTADHFVYNPRDPVPTRGGAVCCTPDVFPWGPMDQRPVEQRNDVLLYTSKALGHDLEVVGPVSVLLYVSTSARDTDFTAKLVDVFPDGTARNLTDGILRLRYRDSLEKANLAVPGTIYPITIDAGVTGNVFLRGHRIRVEVSSSNFPRFDRNPNTGRTVMDETHLISATQAVFHDSRHPSRLELTVLLPHREAIQHR